MIIENTVLVGRLAKRKSGLQMAVIAERLLPHVHWQPKAGSRIATEIKLVEYEQSDESLRVSIQM